MKKAGKLSACLAIAAVLMSTAVIGGEEKVFRCGFETSDDMSGWDKTSDRFSFADEAGIGKSRALVWEGKDILEKSEVFLTPPFDVETGRSYSYTVKARSDSDIVGRVYVRINYKVGGKTVSLEGRPIINNGWKKGRKWSEISGGTGMVPPGATKGQVCISIRNKTTGRVLFDDLEVVATPKRYIRFVQSSAYRDCAVDGTVKFLAMYMMDGRECPLKKRKPEFVVRGADGKELRLAATEVAEDRFSASCEVEKIAIGSYPVVARLVSGDGKEYDAMSIDFNRVETLPERLAWFDEHHRLIVEGKPFFLLGMYGCGKTDAEADIYADSAFNCTLTGNPAALDLAAARGLKVLYSTHRLAHADDAKVESECRKMVGRKEVIVWCTNDELPPGLVPQQTLLYNRLRKYDPGRPVYAVLDKCHHVRDFMPSFDVIAMDPYPIGNKRRGPIAMCTEWPRKANEAVFGFRPVWQVPQAFDWEWHRRNFNASSPEHHFPTRDEFRSMSWQPIALGVKGLIWYSFDWMLKASSPAEFKERWGYMRETVSEIAKFSSVFLSVEPAPLAKTDNARVSVKTWRQGGSCWLLCVNTTEKPQGASVSVSGIPKIGDIKAEIGEKPKMSDKRLKFDLPPLGIAFIKFPVL